MLELPYKPSPLVYRSFVVKLFSKRCFLLWITHIFSHRQIPNWEIQTPKQFLSSPKAIFCYDTVTAAMLSVSLHSAVCGFVDVAGRHSGALFSSQSHCHALKGLCCGADCVAQGRTQECRIVKIALLLTFLHLVPNAGTCATHFGTNFVAWNSVPTIWNP